MVISEAFTGLGCQSEIEIGVLERVGVEFAKPVKAVEERRHCARIHADYWYCRPIAASSWVHGLKIMNAVSGFILEQVSHSAPLFSVLNFRTSISC